MPRPWVSGLVLAAACSPPPAPGLHELPAWAGTVTVARLDVPLRTVRGELTFDRKQGNLQWTFRGQPTRSLLRVPGGELRLFVDGVPATPTTQDAADFVLVELAVRPPGDVRVTALADGYELRTAAGAVAVTGISPRAEHGAR